MEHIPTLYLSLSMSESDLETDNPLTSSKTEKTTTFEDVGQPDMTTILTIAQLYPKDAKSILTPVNLQQLFNFIRLTCLLTIIHSQLAAIWNMLPSSFLAAPPQLCKSNNFSNFFHGYICNTSPQQNHQPRTQNMGFGHPVGPSGLSPDLENYQILVHESEDPHALVVPDPSHASWEVDEGQKSSGNKHQDISKAIPDPIWVTQMYQMHDDHNNKP